MNAGELAITLFAGAAFTTANRVFGQLSLNAENIDPNEQYRRKMYEY